MKVSKETIWIRFLVRTHYGRRNSMSGTAEAKQENDRGTVLMMGVVMGTVWPVRETTASALASLSCR